jgi:hypothetical protein
MVRVLGARDGGAVGREGLLEVVIGRLTQGRREISR